MAATKISDLTSLTGAGTATGDLFVVVDVSDTTMAASGTDKKITFAEALIGLGALPKAGGTMTGTLTSRDIAVQSHSAGTYSYRLSIGTYGTISETGGGLAYITGNSIAADSVDGQLIKTSNDNGHFMRMRYDKGISFHVNISGAIGATVADDVNQIIRVSGAALLFGASGADSQGISKSATDVLEVNNGAVGTYRDLLVRSILIDGAPSSVGAGQIAIGADTRTTIGANGAASALTAAPVGYIDINVAGSSYQIPYYNRGA